MAVQILVTGGAGFLGSHLCKRLVDRGDNVICLDNLFTSRRETISDLESCANFTFLEQDVQDPINVEVEQIFNLACPAAPGHYQFDPVNTLKTSVLGAMQTLELAKRTNATIFHASTSEVYGDPQVHPQKAMGASPFLVGPPLSEKTGQDLATRRLFNARGNLRPMIEPRIIA